MKSGWRDRGRLNSHRGWNGDRVALTREKEARKRNGSASAQGIALCIFHPFSASSATARKNEPTTRNEKNDTADFFKWTSVRYSPFLSMEISTERLIHSLHRWKRNTYACLPFSFFRYRKNHGKWNTRYNCGNRWYLYRYFSREEPTLFDTCRVAHQITR